MATSTETTVRNAIVSAIRAIAVSKLGFQQPDGNVHDYLLEHEQPERDAEYLMADVNGERKVRAWGVWVTADDDWLGTGGLVRRGYTVRIMGYYEIGAAGEGAQALEEGARKIREALKDMTTTLNGTVDRTIDVSPLTIARAANLNASEVAILVGTMTIQADRRNPDF